MDFPEEISHNMKTAIHPKSEMFPLGDYQPKRLKFKSEIFLQIAVDLRKCQKKKYVNTNV